MKLRKILNTTLIAGAVILLIGVIVFLVSFGTTGFNLSTFSYVQYEEKTFREQGTSTTLDIRAEMAHVYLYEAKEGDSLSVQYTRRKNRNDELLNEVKFVEDGDHLSIVETELSEGQPLLLDVTKPRIEVYLPTDRTYDVEISIDIGNVQIAGKFKMETVVLTTKNGSLYTENADVECSAVAFNAINGGINFGGFVADDITSTTTNGSISINGNVTAKSFSAASKNGQIYYRSSVIDAETVLLSSDRGNVKAKLRGPSTDYLTTVTVEKGRSNVDSTDSGTRRLVVTATNGNVHIDFEME